MQLAQLSFLENKIVTITWEDNARSQWWHHEGWGDTRKK